MEEFDPNIEREEQRQRIAVWCGALGAYNSGILHGEWLRADVEPEELWKGINWVLLTSPEPNEEEFGFFDNEGFEGIRIGEYEAVERVTALARLVSEHGEAFAGWYMNDTSVELDEAEEQFHEAYVGSFDNEGELQAHIEQTQGIDEMMQEAYKTMPSWLSIYVQFDIEGFTRDLQFNGDLYTVERQGKLHAYWSR